MNRATIIAGAVAAATLALALLAVPVLNAIDRLGTARRSAATAMALAGRPSGPPPALVASDWRTPGGDSIAAGRAAAARIRALAARGGVLVEQAEPVPMSGGLARVRLRLSGNEKAVLALIDTIERERPLTRMATWQAEALGDGGMRLSGEAVAAWR